MPELNSKGAERMRIMTFNLRFENDRDGENSWLNRRDLVVQIVKKYTPSLLGTQEGTSSQLVYLQENLPDYRIHAPNRLLDATCQYPTLFYRPDRFQLLEGSEFWLSKTPSVHRSKDWDSAFPRMMSYALLEDLSVCRRLWAIVTHLDHIGVEARLEQARIIANWVQQQAEPIILMGDFNTGPDSLVHELLATGETGLRDTWQALSKAENVQSMTHHGFVGTPQKGRIDWVLLSRHFVVRDAAIIRDQFDGRYPSDHFPYAAQVEWARQAMPPGADPLKRD